MAVPAGWGSVCPDTNGEDNCSANDYAVIDFRPFGNNTVVSWFGIQVNQTNLSGLTATGYPTPYYLEGNPTDTVGDPNFSPTNNPNGIAGCGGANPYFAYPWMCGMGGPGEVNGDYVESDTINVSPGHSGSPWWLVEGNGDTQIIGIVTGDTTYHDLFRCGTNPCYRNFGRHIDSTVWNFFTSNSEL
jgi:hypothetical protein